MATSPAAVTNGDHAIPADTGQAGYPRRWLAAIVLIVGALMDMIDVTIVNVALPSIRRDLHASATQLEWVVSGYMLAFAATLIIAGNLGDKFGRKRLFLSGAALFGLASLAAGLSGSGAELIAARVVQGAAAAAMAPQVLATFRVIFGRAERGKAFGVYGAMLGFASAIGLVLGGLLTGANLFGWEWRSVFYVNVPVAVAALIAGARFVPETKDPGARRPFVAGAVLLAGSLVAIVYPLLEGRQLGWPAWVWPLMAAGVAGLVVLGLIEARRTSTTVAPLLRAGLFRVPAFAAGMGVQLAFFAGMQGFFIAFALWLQAGEHFSPLKAGLTAVAFSVGSFIAAPVAVPLAQKAGRRILAGGAVLMVAGIGGVALAAPHVGLNGSPCRSSPAWWWPARALPCWSSRWSTWCWPRSRPRWRAARPGCSAPRSSWAERSAWPCWAPCSSGTWTGTRSRRPWSTPRRTRWARSPCAASCRCCCRARR